ncbi:MAG: AsmA family protein, partial [Bradyrhizobium sp.]
LGLNVAQMIRNLTTGTLSGWQQGEALSTDLSQLSASFKLDKGQAVTTDLNLIGPLVKMSGVGTVDLNTRQLGFRVEPQLVMTTEGQGRAGNPVGLGIPVMVEGPWVSPRIYPEMQGILDNPQAAYAKLKEMGKGLFGANGQALSQQGISQGLNGLTNLLNGAQAGGNGAQPGTGQAPGGAGQGNPLGGQLGDTIGNLLQQGLSTLNQGNAARPSRSLAQPTPDAPQAAAPPPPNPPPADTAERRDNPAMNDVLRQLFNR